MLGTLATAIVTGLAAAWLFDIDTVQGMLIGSIVAATDGAAVFAVLRGSTLRRKLARTLEGEAGLNDPVAVLLVLGFIEWIQQPGYGVVDMLGLFGEQLGIGLAVGLAAGGAGLWLLPRIAACVRGAVSGRVAGAGGAVVRRRRRAARLRLPRRLPDRPRDRQHEHRGDEDDGGLPRRPRLARTGRRCSSSSVCSCSQPAR